MSFGRREARTFDGVEYAPGRQFVVQVDGILLSGMVPVQGGYSGWGQTLQIGDVVTCTGFGPGWGSDPGYGVEWTSEEAKAALASHCELHPSVGGMWAYRPAIGLVLPLEEATP